MPTPNKMEIQIFFFSAEAKQSNSPIDLHSVHLTAKCLTLGPLLVTSAEVHIVAALKEEPKSLGPCVVAW